MKDWFGKNVSNLLFGGMTACLMTEIAVGSKWGMIFLGFLWGWCLVTTIQSCLIQQDIHVLQRENEMTWRDIDEMRAKRKLLEGLNDARKRESVQVFTVRPPDTMH
jgi:hypothetical protein